MLVSLLAGTFAHVVGEEQFPHGFEHHRPVEVAMVRWSVTANSRATPRSCRPHNSARTGWAAVGGKTSMMPPRTAN